MPTPFPGMDPYLERAEVWEEVHTRLIVAIADALGPQVRPKYRVGVEQVKDAEGKEVQKRANQPYHLWCLACTRRAVRSRTITLSTLWPLCQFLGG